MCISSTDAHCYRLCCLSPFLCECACLQHKKLLPQPAGPRTLKGAAACLDQAPPAGGDLLLEASQQHGTPAHCWTLLVQTPLVYPKCQACQRQLVALGLQHPVVDAPDFAGLGASVRQNPVGPAAVPACDLMIRDAAADEHSREQQCWLRWLCQGWQTQSPGCCCWRQQGLEMRGLSWDSGSLHKCANLWDRSVRATSAIAVLHCPAQDRAYQSGRILALQAASCPMHQLYVRQSALMCSWENRNCIV